MESTHDQEMVLRLIEHGDWDAIRGVIRAWPAADIAELLRSVEGSARCEVFRLAPRELAPDVFANVGGNARDYLLQSLSEEETQDIIQRMHPDDRTRLLSGLQGTAVQRILNLLRGEQLAEAKLLLGYPEESIGRLMTPEYVAVREHWRTQLALEHVRKVGPKVEHLTSVLVVDDGWVFQGVLSLQRLVLAPVNVRVGSLVEETLTVLHPEDDREVAVELMLHYDAVVLPVVDANGILLGVVTADDVFDVAEEEATEDIHLSAAVTPLRGSYRDAGIVDLCRKRLPWLGSLIFVNLAASGVIAAYEDTLARVVALTFFLPLLLGAAGNAGAQASTLTVRALATGDLTGAEWTRVLLKELGVGLALGGAMAILAWILASWRADFQVGLIVSLTMALVIVVANLVGVTLPFLLSRLRVDPAVASNPLITSVCDVTGVAIYLAMAAAIIPVAMR